MSVFGNKEKQRDGDRGQMETMMLIIMRRKRKKRWMVVMLVEVVELAVRSAE